MMPPAVFGKGREGRRRLLNKMIYYAPKRTCLYLTNVRMISTAIADEGKETKKRKEKRDRERAKRFQVCTRREGVKGMR